MAKYMEYVKRTPCEWIVTRRLLEERINIETLEEKEVPTRTLHV